MAKKLFHLFLVFNLIFAPVYPLIENGIILSLILSAIYLARSRKSLLCTNEFFRNNYIKATLIFPIVVIIAILLIAITHKETLETAYMANYIGLIATAISAFLVCTIVYSQNGKSILYVIDLILLCFSVQTIIMLLAQASPVVLEFVQFFQSKAMVGLDREPIFRRLLLSSAGFFGIGLIYGFTYILLAHKLLLTRNVTLLDFIYFLLLFIGNMYTARTGFVGLIFAIFYIVMSGTKIGFKIFAKFSIFLSVILVIGFLLLTKNSNVFDEQVLNFAFEMFVSDELETNSTNGLKTMWDRDMSKSTFFVGDGIMYNKDGSYYKHTDVGYLRNIFFGGILFLALLSIMQLYIIAQPFYKHQEIRTLVLVMIGYVFALHIKGEAIMFSRVLMSEMYLFLFALYYDVKKECERNK